jgi:type II protein arginine methyltransferase
LIPQQISSLEDMSLGWFPSETEKLLANSLQNLLSNSKNNNFTFLTVPIQVNKEIFNNLQDLETLQKWQRTLIASSDRSLYDSNDWSNRVLFNISTNDPNLEYLLEYAGHLTVFAILIEDDWIIESVQKLMKMNKSSQFPFKFYLKCDFYDWEKWRNLQNELSESDKKEIGVVPDLKESKIDFHMKIWQCEALKGLIINEGVFLKNSKGYPVLPHVIQNYLRDLKHILDYPIILKTSQSLSGDCATYIKWLVDPIRPENHLSEAEKRMKMFAEGFENVLQTPLQPLRDHLPSETYEIFERDPIKYRLYEEAIEAALRDKSITKLMKIGVFGAGRGPLVQATLNASEKIENCRIHVVALEKSPNACLTLLDRFKSHANVEVIFGDMRNAKIEEGSLDIIVSELLGSFGDNELSPECLWPVESFLKPDGVFIPQEYTSYIEPCYAPILRSQVIELQGVLEGDSFDYGYVVHVTRAMTMNNSLPVFKFEHPKTKKDDGVRTVELEFHNCPQLVDGLIGYFDCKLYGNVRMSTLPGNTSSPGMLSWFPIYFPLKTIPSTSNSMSVSFKRCKDSERVWYEWKVLQSQEYQNFEGKSFSIKL